MSSGNASASAAATTAQPEQQSQPQQEQQQQQQQESPEQLSPPTSKQVYACRHCRLQLFTTDHIVPHDTDGDAAGHKLFHKNRVHTESGAGKQCTSVFLDEGSLEWVLTSSCGKDDDPNDLLCPNEKCRAKLGARLWQGTQCSCGAWVTPAFKVTLSRVDAFPLAA